MPRGNQGELKGLAALKQLQNPVEQHQSQVDEKRERERAKPLEAKLDKERNFHNPYNFVPTMARDKEWFIAKDEGLDSLLKQLGDKLPVSHSSYDQESWSGQLKLQLTTQTPLLIPDAAKATTVNRQGHQSFPLRIVDGKPYLAPTSLKGMLRSGYEAITNSRLSIFQGHGDRLAYRMAATDGLSLVPVRISGDAEKIELLLGTTKDIPTFNEQVGRWQIPGSLMYAAWLPRYENRSSNISRNAVAFPGMHHGQHVKAWVQKVNRHPFSYWRVCPNSMVPANQTLSATPVLWDGGNAKRHEPTDETMEVEGYLSLTGKNIGRKYNERLLFLDPTHRLKKQLTIELDSTESKRLKSEWRELIVNYQEEHASDIERGQTSPPQAENGAQWSQYITGSRGLSKEKEAQLEDGTICYAKVERRGNQLEIISLYPVMIARTLFGESPDSLLSDSLKPAESLEQLSPADRVFGWVNQNGNGAHKGQIRIHSVSCQSTDAVTALTSNVESDPGLALGILGQPKPTQTRFYAASDSQGSTLDGMPKKDGYQKKQGLRGRKVYPHHKTEPAHWNESRPAREYARPEQERDSQNRSIQAWVKPQTRFDFQINLINLSSVELGALLWLLTLEQGHYHRLGGGKPYGFGSVSLSVDWAASDLRQGKQWQDYYGTLEPITRLDIGPLEEQARTLKAQFETALKAAYGSSQLLLPSFLRMAKGFEDDLPIHYPRNQATSTVDDENFKWFEENEGSDKLALPMLVNDTGLPRFPETVPTNQPARGRAEAPRRGPGNRPARPVPRPRGGN